jgi:hypothetical protein
MRQRRLVCATQVILLEALPQKSTAAVQAIGAELGKMTSEGSGNSEYDDLKELMFKSAAHTLRQRCGPWLTLSHFCTFLRAGSYFN